MREKSKGSRPGGLLDRAWALLARPAEAGRAQRAAALAFAIRIVNAVLVYASQVVLARLMGQHEYGVFAYTWVWFLVFSTVASLGFPESTLRYLPAYRERRELDKLRGFLRLAPFVVIAASVLVAGAAAVALSLAGDRIDPAYVLPMLLMLAALPFASIQAYLEGIARVHFWTLTGLGPVYILRHALLLALMIGAVLVGFAASAAVAMACVILTVALSLILQWAVIAVRLKRVVAPGPRAYQTREWIIGSAPFSVMYGSAQLFAFADVVVLSFFVTPGQLAVYFAATRVIQVIGLVPFAASVGTAQLFSAHHAAGDLERMRRITHEVTFWTTLISIAFAGLMVGIGHWLLTLFGSGFEAGYIALVILAAGMVVRVAGGPAEDLLNMTGHSRLSAWTYVVTVTLNVVLNITLIPIYGITGAAIATSIALLIRAVWLAVAARRRLGIDASIFSARASLSTVRGLIPPGREKRQPAE